MLLRVVDRGISNSENEWTQCFSNICVTFKDLCELSKQMTFLLNWFHIVVSEKPKDKGEHIANRVSKSTQISVILTPVNPPLVPKSAETKGVTGYPTGPKNHLYILGRFALRNRDLDDQTPVFFAPAAPPKISEIKYLKNPRSQNQGRRLYWSQFHCCLGESTYLQRSGTLLKLCNISPILNIEHSAWY